MRYPIGTRLTLAQACDAARESAQLTKMRYRVEITRTISQRFMSDQPRLVAVFNFKPAIEPDPTKHDGWNT